MIKANELRIGNWCYWNQPTSKPEIISAYDFESIVEGGNVPYPIPLTHEILEKCGFVRSNPASFSWCIDTLPFSEIRLEGSGICFMILTGNIYQCLNKEQKYLHQLQNLVFALTGKELQITL